MNVLKLAAKELFKHPIRTVLTVLLFSLALGGITYAVSPSFLKPAEHYDQVLKQNNVRNFCIGTTKNSSVKDIKKIFPQDQNLYPIYANDFMRDGEIELHDVTEADAERMGVEVKVGRLPVGEAEYAWSEEMFEQLKIDGVTIETEENYAGKKFYFKTFEEAQEILNRRFVPDPVFYQPVAYPYRLVGLFSTDFKQEIVDRLYRQSDGLKLESENNNVRDKIKLYERTAPKFISLGVSKNSLYPMNPKVNGDGTIDYFSYLPEKSEDRERLFNALEQDQAKSGFGAASSKKYFRVENVFYLEDFASIVSYKRALWIFSAPVALIFMMIALILVISLEKTCAKSQKEEIGTLRSLGMTSGAVYRVALVRSFIVSFLSFVFSIGFAFLFEFAFKANTGIFALILGRFELSLGILPRIGMLSFVPFLITLAFSAVVGLLGSVAGYRRYQKKSPAEIYRMSRD